MLKVNLQPKVTLEVKEGFKMPVWAPVILLIVIGCFAGYTHWLVHRDIAISESRIKQLDFKLRDFQKTLNEYQAAVYEKEYLQDKRDFVNGISQNQKMWVDFFDELKAKIPKDVWLTRFEGVRSGNYSLEGDTFSFGSIGFFMIQFKSIPDITTITLDAAMSRSGSGGGSAAEAIAKTFKIGGAMKLGGNGPSQNATATVTAPVRRSPAAPAVPVRRSPAVPGLD
jgi:Tfp pilus assembly protein PilN